jgi:hypothetical protein
VKVGSEKDTVGCVYVETGSFLKISHTSHNGHKNVSETPSLLISDSTAPIDRRGSRVPGPLKSQHGEQQASEAEQGTELEPPLLYPCPSYFH